MNKINVPILMPVTPNPSGGACPPDNSGGAPPAQRTPPKPSNDCCDPARVAYRAWTEAEADYQVVDAARPNKVLGLGQTTPSSTVATGAVAFTATSMPKGYQPRYLIGCDVDKTNFCISQVTFNGTAIVEGGIPVPIDAFAPTLDHQDRHIPFVGMVFDKAVDVQLTVFNLSGAPALFRNMGLAVFDPWCNAGYQRDTQVAPGGRGLVWFWGLVDSIREWFRI